MFSNGELNKSWEQVMFDIAFDKTLSIKEQKNRLWEISKHYSGCAGQRDHLCNLMVNISGNDQYFLLKPEYFQVNT